MISKFTQVVRLVILLQSSLVFSLQMSSDSQSLRSSVGHHQDIDADIAIIGGGLAGLSLASGLSRLNNKLSIHIFEKRLAFTEAGASFGLQPNGIKALEEITPGVVDVLRVDGIPLTRNNGLLLPWWKVRDALLAHTQQYSNVHIHMGEEILEIIDNSINENKNNNNENNKQYSHVTAKFKSGRRCKSSLLIAADGSHSYVRQLLQLPPAVPTGMKTWRGRITCPNMDQEPFQSILNNGIVPLGRVSEKDSKSTFLAFNFHLKQPGLICWTFSRIVEQSIVDESKLSTKEFIIDCFKTIDNQEIFQKLCHIVNHTPNDQISQSTQYIVNLPPPSSLLTSIYNSTACSTTTAIDKINITPIANTDIVDNNSILTAATAITTGWGGTGRVTLIGDAAHAMQPADGQGGSQTFEDCVMFCRLIKQQSSSNNVCSSNTISATAFANTNSANKLIESNDSTINTLPTIQELLSDPISCQQFIHAFESSRLPRVRIIHDNQREVTENRVNGGNMQWSPEFAKWVYDGV